MSSFVQNMNAARFTPKYVQLARLLLRDISTKGLVEGDRLPTEVGIAEQYKLSRVTVRQALDLLETEGIVSRVRARGTFVNRAVDSVESFGIVNGTVLLICSNEQRSNLHDDTALATVLCDVEQTLSQRGFAVQLTTLSRQVAEDRERLKNVIEGTHNLRGALVLGYAFEPYRDMFGDLSVVTMSTFQPTVSPWVGTDIVHMARESVGHLLANGHRNVAMACGKQLDQAGLEAFLQGYQQAHEQAGVKVQRSLIYSCHPGESLDELAEHVLTGPVKPTGVFAENWLVCRALLSAAERLNLSVPADVSLVGFGLNVREITQPVAMTAYIPADVGPTAAKLLVDLISGDRPPPTEPILIPGKIEEHASVRNLNDHAT